MGGTAGISCWIWTSSAGAWDGCAGGGNGRSASSCKGTSGGRSGAEESCALGTVTEFCAGNGVSPAAPFVFRDSANTGAVEGVAFGGIMRFVFAGGTGRARRAARLGRGGGAGDAVRDGGAMPGAGDAVRDGVAGAIVSAAAEAGGAVSATLGTVTGNTGASTSSGTLPANGVLSPTCVSSWGCSDAANVTTTGDSGRGI